MTLSRPLLIGLIVSAALNVFLIGGVAGVLWVRQTAPPAPPPVAAPEPITEGAPSQPSTAQPPLRQPSPALPTAPAAGQGMGKGAGQGGGRAPLWSAGQGLSPESRRALRQALRDANKRNQPITRQARAERQAAVQALKSKSYDPAEVAKRLAAARALDVQARGNVEGALAAYAATLSPAERGALADGLARVYAPRQKLSRATED